MRIAFVYSEGRESRLVAAAAGQVPTDFFYGAMELANSGHKIVFTQVNNRASSRFAGWLDVLFGRWMPARFRIANFAAARRILPELNHTDCIVAANSQVGMSLGLLRKLGKLKPPIVAIHCGVVNWRHDPWRLKVSRPLFAQQEVVLFADSEAPAMASAFQIPARHLHICPFGVDVKFWQPAAAPRKFVFAIGNDGRRDFDTFARAAGAVDFPHRLLSRLALTVPAPPNLEYIPGHWSQGAVTDVVLRDWYQESLCVVVPLADAIQPSGQSVALQAMACGRPVIITRTSGYWLHPDFKDGEHVLIVEPGSVEALAAAINRLVKDPSLAEKMGAAGRDLMLRHYSIQKFAQGIEAACQHAVAHPA